MTHKFSFSFRHLTRRDQVSAPQTSIASPRALAAFSKRRLRLALGPFRRRVRHVEAILRDVNGPRGGVDQACTIKVHLEPSDLLVVESRSDSAYSAIADATRRANAAVQRRLQRRRAVARSRFAAEPWRNVAEERRLHRDRSPHAGQLVG